MIAQRYIGHAVRDDLTKKMVFIGGPHQVGKTSLAQPLMDEHRGSLYLNYDNLKHRKIMREQQWSEADNLLVFDEVHKMPKWKSWVKGIYDVGRTRHQILVTGSARLDTA